jgi:hypothetical protein
MERFSTVGWRTVKFLAPGRNSRVISKVKLQ